MCVIFSKYTLQHLATFLRQGFDHLKDSVFEDLGSEMGLLKALSLECHVSLLVSWHPQHIKDLLWIHGVPHFRLYISEMYSVQGSAF